MKKLLAAFVFLFCFVQIHAQETHKTTTDQLTSKEEKKVAKSQTYYDEGKYDKAISTLQPVVMKHLYNDDLWSLLVNYENTRYETEYSALVQTMLYSSIFSGKKNQSVTVSGKALVDQQELISVCYQATMYCFQQENACILLRTLTVDHKVDSAVNKDAKDEFNEGEKDFRTKNYAGAVHHYKRALGYDSTYYKAALYVGDAYYNDEEYEKSLPWFQDAIRRQPDLLEPRKYLVDAYMKLKRWDDAYTACVDAIVVYPDNGMLIRLKKIADNLDKSFNQHWMPRTVIPNQMNVSSPATATDPWMYYAQAKDKIKDYCDENGVITKQQSLTQQNYLEVYSWESMLKQSTYNEGEFAFARKMMDAGYLDCYCMISVYHAYFYKQYADFAKKNADRIRTYINTYLVK